MFTFFKRRKGEIATAHRGWNRVGLWMDQQQRRYADWLQVRSANLSAKTLTILLLLFCIFFAGCCSYILYQTFY